MQETFIRYFMKNKILIMTVLLIGLLSCQNQKPAENGSFTTASYNLRYANAEDSAAGNGWGKRYPVMAKLIPQFRHFRYSRRIYPATGRHESRFTGI